MNRPSPAPVPPPLLRSESPAARRVGIVLAFAVGAAGAGLVALGNPGNMGVCGACFLRDLAGAMWISPGPSIFRPEVAGMILGALALSIVRGRFAARSGSHAASRFLLGVVMAFAALVFLGCPFRTLQRLGGGDLNAWVAVPGFVAGVGVGVLFERRGYSVGRTSVVPAPVGLLGPLVITAVLAAFLVGGLLRGPGPGAEGGPPHAPWLASLGIALAAGAALSETGFCAVTAARRVFLPGKAMLVAAGAIVLGFAVVAAVTGRFSLSFTAPIAHSEAVWNVAALAVLGLAGVLAGGCPVRQVVMTGEGNGDAFVTIVGLVVGGALAHAWGAVSGPGGPTDAGRTAVVVGLVFTAAYGFAMTRGRAPAAA